MSRLGQIVAALEKHYGRLPAPRVTDPFEMILYESAAYLVDDERRDRVWAALKKQVGVRPREILAVSAAHLGAVIKDGGMQPVMRARKLRTAATLVLDEFGGDLKGVLKGPLKEARRALKKYPGVGDPGADKILLFTRTEPVLALESNGLRALVRLGYGEESENYSAMHRSAQAAIAPEVELDFDWLIGAHQLLRLHGQSLCKRSEPRCAECPLAATCPVGRAVGYAGERAWSGGPTSSSARRRPRSS
jgi:endonuclease-3